MGQVIQPLSGLRTVAAPKPVPILVIKRRPAVLSVRRGSPKIRKSSADRTGNDIAAASRSFIRIQGAPIEERTSPSLITHGAFVRLTGPESTGPAAPIAAPEHPADPPVSLR